MIQKVLVISVKGTSGLTFKDVELFLMYLTLLCLFYSSSQRPVTDIMFEVPFLHLLCLRMDQFTKVKKTNLTSFLLTERQEVLDLLVLQNVMA